MTLFTTADAARVMGVAEGTIRVWAQRGRLRRFGTPCRALWAVEDLAAIVDA